MCGIAGYINISRSTFPLHDELLARFQQSMAHRGPDGHGIWHSARHGVAFVHRRLSIVDLSQAGHQPMLDPEQSVAVIFNGEIYNHQKLRLELEALGYRYRSHTDTETILYAYKAWGINFLHRLEGMFAIALFDLRTNELYLVRDRIGVKPLYFSLQGGMLSFASEIKSLWQLPWVEKKINSQALYHYLTYLATPAPETLYAGVYKLPPSFYMKIGANREYTFHEWYCPIQPLSDAEKKQFDDEQFCIDGVRTLLRQAVEKRMMADVPFGVFLSGGIDSSLNVALMSEFTDRVKTFTVAFKDGPEYDELQWARQVAKTFNTDHHEIIISEKEAFEFFNSMVYHQDEPLADCVCIPLYYVSKLVRDSGVVVVQVGEGSDELFCGYSTYARYLDVQKRYWQPTQRFIPAFARQAAYTIAKTIAADKYNRLDMLNNWAHDRSFFWSGATAFSELFKEQIFTANKTTEIDPIVARIYPAMAQQYDSYAIVDFHLKKLAARDPEADYLKSMIYLEFKQRLPELLLMRVDKMTMATSIEGRVPFLDHKLVEFAFNIPTKFKYAHGQTKYILKKAAEGIIPHDIIYRKKMGFAAPTKRWFESGDYFKPYLQDLLATNGAWHDYIDGQTIKKMAAAHSAGARDYSVQLWTLQNFMAATI